MDARCSALDPIATRRIEDMNELKARFTIAIVNHNLQQANRVVDSTEFIFAETTQGGRTGYLVEIPRPTSRSRARNKSTIATDAAGAQ